MERDAHEACEGCGKFVESLSAEEDDGDPIKGGRFFTIKQDIFPRTRSCLQLNRCPDLATNRANVDRESQSQCGDIYLHNFFQTNSEKGQWHCSSRQERGNKWSAVGSRCQPMDEITRSCW